MVSLKRKQSNQLNKPRYKVHGESHEDADITAFTLNAYNRKGYFLSIRSVFNLIITQHEEQK